MKEPQYSRQYFTRKPEALSIEVGCIETDHTQPSVELTRHAADWFNLYYDALHAFKSHDEAPQPHQPNALKSLVVTPHATTIEAKPLLTIAGVYDFRDSIGQVTREQTPPVALSIETHGGYEQHLSYTDAFRESNQMTPLNDRLSLDVTCMMINYYRTIVIPRRSKQKGL